MTVSNTKSLKYICGNFTFEALNLHREKSTLEKIVPQGLIRNTNSGPDMAGLAVPPTNLDGATAPLALNSGRYDGFLFYVII